MVDLSIDLLSFVGTVQYCNEKIYSAKKVLKNIKIIR